MEVVAMAELDERNEIIFAVTSSKGVMGIRNDYGFDENR
jgi:hypothetical protein